MLFTSNIAWNKNQQYDHKCNIFVYFQIFMLSNIHSSLEKHKFQKPSKLIFFDLSPTIYPKVIQFNIKHVLFCAIWRSKFNLQGGILSILLVLSILICQFRSSILRIVTKSLKNTTFTLNLLFAKTIISSIFEVFYVFLP